MFLEQRILNLIAPFITVYHDDVGFFSRRRIFSLFARESLAPRRRGLSSLEFPLAVRSGHLLSLRCL